MTKTIHTLVDDMYAVVNGAGGWDGAITEYLSDEIKELAQRRFEDGGEASRERPPTLRMSNLGVPCERKLWYGINRADVGEGFSPATLIKFFYGDLIEVLLIALAKAAGHKVEGEQDELEIEGIVGHRDCVIDGVTIDVKSAAPRSFQKFKNGGLRQDDAFGYISQLSSYVFAGREHTVASDPTLGGFLVADKVSGELHLDLHDFSADIEGKREEVKRLKAMANDADTLPDRGFEAEASGYKKKGVLVPNGNYQLGLNCSYCDKKHECWPDLRTFMYKRGTGYGPTYFTHIAKEPNVMEVT